MSFSQFFTPDSSSIRGSITGRALFIKVLDLFVSRLESMESQFTQIVKYHHHKKAKLDGPENWQGDIQMDGFLDLGYSEPIKVHVKPWDVSSVDLATGALQLITYASGESKSDSVCRIQKLPQDYEHHHQSCRYSFPSL